MQKLIQVVEKLRSKEGCPWDKKQTHESLIPYLLEEAWEVIEEIKTGRTGEDLKDELGDLLFQVLLHSQIAAEDGRFTIEDVIRQVTEKMIERHPHVFSDASKGQSEAELTEQWNQIKAKKRAGKSVMEGIPNQGSQLLQAKKIGERAASLNFEFPNTEQIIEKIHEELEEVKVEIRQGNQQKLESEIGDLLFAVTNLARFQGINPEIALKATNDKFKSRFQPIEAAIQQAKAEGKTLTLDEMEAEWNKAKQSE